MSRPYRESDLSDQFDSDISWRLRELSDFKSVTIAASGTAKRALLRALVPILYAHWEGHVRFCAQKFFDFVSLRRFQFSQLNRQFYINNFLPRFDTFYLQRPNLDERASLIENILNSTSNRFSRVHPALIDTRSNLSSEVLQDICKICAVDYNLFSSRADFIDKIILRRRNSIAHGEETYVDERDVDVLIDDTISLMRLFKNSLENIVYTQSYLKGTS